MKYLYYFVTFGSNNYTIPFPTYKNRVFYEFLVFSAFC